MEKMNFKKKPGRPRIDYQIVDEAMTKYATTNIPAYKIANEYKISMPTFKRYWRAFVSFHKAKIEEGTQVSEEISKALSQSNLENADIKELDDLIYRGEQALEEKKRLAYETHKDLKIPQHEAAKKYGISQATLNRYIKSLNGK